MKTVITTTIISAGIILNALLIPNLRKFLSDFQLPQIRYPDTRKNNITPNVCISYLPIDIASSPRRTAECPTMTANAPINLIQSNRLVRALVLDIYEINLCTKYGNGSARAGKRMSSMILLRCCPGLPLPASGWQRPRQPAPGRRNKGPRRRNRPSGCRKGCPCARR